MKKTFMIALALVTTLTGIAQVCLQPIATYTAGGTFMANADFNNDGKMDLVAGHSGALHMMLGDGAGNFTASSVTSVSYLGAMISADLNNDGKADLVVANNSFNGSNIVVFLGDGNGGFSASTPFPTNLTPWGMTANDLNGDGNLDLAITNVSVNNMSVLIGDGTGNFSPKVDYTFGNLSSFGTTNQVISQDFNADGKIDLIVSSRDSLVVFLGDGSGTFANYSLYPGGPSTNGSFLVANDFNGDGLADIAAADGTSGVIAVWPGTGTGAFGTAIHTTLPANMQAGNLSCADFNSDGKKDLALCTQNWNRIVLLLGDGTGNFQAPIFFADTDVPEICIAQDLNADGKPDLAVGNQQGNANFMIFLNVAAPNLNLASATALCANASATLTASGATTYTWSANSGISDPSYTTAIAVVTPTANTTYSLMAQTNGCRDSASVSFNIVFPQTPNICMVTTDSAHLYQYNVVVWDKTPYANVDSFIIYRKDALSSSYLRIGAVSKNSLSEFVDTCFSIGGPNAGNPLFSSWTYKMAIKDTCGNVGVMSPYHQTMFVQQNGSNFSWNAYTVEAGQSNPVTGYSFLRDNNNTGAWQVLVNTSATSSTDPNYSNYPNGNWRVDAIGFNCSSSMRLSNNVETHYSKARSNTSKLAVTGVSHINDFELALYPNPSNGIFTIEGRNSEARSLKIFSVIGEMLYETHLETGRNTIQLNVPKGTYVAHIISENGVVVKRLVIE